VYPDSSQYATVLRRDRDYFEIWQGRGLLPGGLSPRVVDPLFAARFLSGTCPTVTQLIPVTERSGQCVASSRRMPTSLFDT
jgi:hypothetical protein